MTANAAEGVKQRSPYLDLLRIMAVALVIVNHTNSRVFRACTPAQATWFVSVLWYYISKIAVPLFVMVSGACLLPKVDGYRKVGWRALRVLLTLLVFSYGYYLFDAWVYYGLWPRAVDFASFFSLVWTQQITNSYWYLYFYLGMMIMLPLMQRMAKSMNKRDLCYLIGLAFGLDALWPLLVHYVPALALPSYFQTPMLTAYVGLFFAGHMVHQHFKSSKKSAWLCALVLVASVGTSVLLTYAEFNRVAVGENYLFMDDRMQPSILTLLAAVAAMGLCKQLMERRHSEKASRALAQLGGCAFGVYLVQDFVIAQSKTRLFMPLCGIMPSFAAALVWEAFVLAAALLMAWVLRKIPGLRKLL
ncbi:MAG: acyltransferase [Clostridia bacterium]